MSRLARRMQGIAPFRVMEMMDLARNLEMRGRSVVHMEVGEPDFVTPQPIIDAGRKALENGLTHYTSSVGLRVLREAIASYYQVRFGVDVDPGRILITPGASGALQLVLGVLVDPGDRVAITDPGYPCNRHMISMFGGVPVPLPVSAATNFVIDPDDLRAALREGLRALMVASPSNPTGTLIGPDALAGLRAELRTHPGSLMICDEIYQGLQYDDPPATALALGGDDIIVINSFSKFFGMTGWRVGWVVAPEWMVEPMERLAQNIILAPSTPAQHAALAAFTPAAAEILEARRMKFAARRDFLFQALNDIGFDIPSSPGGAFYLYADAHAFTGDSTAFCRDVLANAAVAFTPGGDFGRFLADRHVRFAFTTGTAQLGEGVERLRHHLAAGS